MDSSTSTFPLHQAFPQTSSLSREDLQDLMIDEAYHHAFVNTLPQVRAKLDEIDRLERENQELAERNLALQPGLAQLRSETMAAFTQAQELKARWKEIEKEQASVYQRYSSSFLHLRLRHSVTEQDDLSESLANSFIEGSRSDTPNADAAFPADRSSRALDDFVREFRTARKVYHKRAIYLERWSRGEVAWSGE